LRCQLRTWQLLDALSHSWPNEELDFVWIEKKRRKAFDSVILCGGTRKMKAAAVLYICSKRSYWAKP